MLSYLSRSDRPNNHHFRNENQTKPPTTGLAGSRQDLAGNPHTPAWVWWSRCVGFCRCRKLAGGWGLDLGRGRSGARFTSPVVDGWGRGLSPDGSLIAVTSWITTVSNKILLKRSLQKKLFFATCISPRVRSLYTWRTVGHVKTRGESGCH
jgi:hypothetical protein